MTGIVKIENSVVSEAILEPSCASKPYFVANITGAAALGALAATVQAISGKPRTPSKSIIPNDSSGITINLNIPGK